VLPVCLLIGERPSRNLSPSVAGPGWHRAGAPL